MILYNITTHVTWTVLPEWKDWLLQTHLPAILATKLFTRHQLVRLLEVDEEQGITFALQLYAKNASDFKEYRERFEAAMERKSKERWGNGTLSFSSVMEVIN